MNGKKKKKKFLKGTEEEENLLPGSQGRSATCPQGSMDPSSSGPTSGFSALLPNNNFCASTIKICKPEIQKIRSIQLKAKAVIKI